MSSRKLLWYTLLAVFIVFIFSNPKACAQQQPGKLGNKQNLTAATENVLIFWTDGPKLKAVTLMAITPRKKPVGIVSIPINTRIHEIRGVVTLEELYHHTGREGTTAYLEKRFGIPINHYVDISQATLTRTSEALGPVEMAGKQTSLLEVFEGTYTNQRMDLQTEIRTLAARLIEPAVLIKLPRLLWIFTSGVETNLGMGSILALYQALQGNGPEILRKQALPGRDYFVGPTRYREVSPDAWNRVLREVTCT
ncbi:LCP family protein [Desulfofundulus thermosubterraneus]|uniref:Transcriptional attenuator, LytR family n=1 Tax=Desulfofundulus thermosubterraneus DSM 16057 TaxID=1121432 RepID=A0A1M6IHA4_9FIRM|nr:LCP family protein [Desulfofundulus thermosubterraneus]SHJ33835.1 transcriptional attenuator, LytR family [Desulfofundulus thermosubterraneus DSM 16057]